VPKPSSDEEREMMVQGVGECADYCADRGVLLASEEYAPVDFWKRFIKEVGSPALRINLHLARVWRDMYHANGVIKEPSLPGAVRDFGDLIVHTHCMDYKTVSALPPLSSPTKSHTVEVVPGAGECDYSDFIRALKEINSTGYLTIESHRSDIPPDIQASQALQSMRRLIQQAT
jgi:sugar phosphate isomerase/epimerase